MKCSKCDSEVAAEAIFCHRCGAPLESSVLGAKTASGTAASEAADASPAASADRTPPGSAQQLGARRADDPPEETLWEGGYSPKAMAGSWAIAALASIVFAVAAALLWTSIYPWGWVLLAAILLIWLYLLMGLIYHRLSVRYKLTNQRFFHERGLLRRVTNRIEVIDIDDIAYEQGVLDRMLGTGRIKISSSDRTDPMLWLDGIEDVRTVASRIDEARRQERMRRGLYVESI